MDASIHPLASRLMEEDMRLNSIVTSLGASKDRSMRLNQPGPSRQEILTENESRLGRLTTRKGMPLSSSKDSEAPMYEIESACNW